MAIEPCEWKPENESVEQCRLARDIFFNPFRQLRFNSQWLSWNHGVIERMARTIYDEQRYQDVPVLGDAFEEAGCREAVILDHCHQPGEHVRGCWVVDFVTRRDDIPFVPL